MKKGKERSTRGSWPSQYAKMLQRHSFLRLTRGDHAWTRNRSGRCGLSKPVFETRLAESCVIARNQCPIADFRPGVKRFRIRDDFAGIFEGGQPPPNQIIQAKLFRPSYLHDAVYGRAYRDPAYGTRDVVSSHRLEKHGRQTHHFALGGDVGEALKELKELRCTDD